MGNLSEKAAYLRGLADGIEVTSSNLKEGKLLAKVVEFLGEVAGEVDELTVVQEEMCEVIDQLDDDLSDLSDFVFDIDEAEEDDMDDFNFDDMDYEEIECPHCHEVLELDDIMLKKDEEQIICPSCHNEIKLELDECDCPHCHHEDTEEE